MSLIPGRTVFYLPFYSIVVMKDSDPKSPSGKKVYRFNSSVRQYKQELEAEIKEES